MDATLLNRLESYLANETEPFFLKEAQDLKAAGNLRELAERFGADLEFGTGGLRGLIGAGFNRMNSFVTRRASQGIADYAKTAVKGPLSAVVSFDSRRFSQSFALQTALTFAANGIKTYLFKELRPTPQLSFSVRHFKAALGVMITASHNPPAYNGYKAYWSDGAQILPPHDKGIIQAALAVQNVKNITEEEALAKGLLVYILEEADSAYQDMIHAYLLRPHIFKQQPLAVVYTPLHGSGAQPCGKAFKRAGVNFSLVERQAQPDGAFPTVKTPNPEDPQALAMGIALAKAKQAQLVIGTDPDADRIGLAVLDKGTFVPLTGNQAGAIFLDYILAARKEAGTLQANHAFINTIVTSELQNAIAKSYGIRSFRTLTGFKYIAEKMKDFESLGSFEFLFGAEESCGYLIEKEARDKDAVSAALLAAECAAWNAARQRTLTDHLEELYQTHGYFEETQVSYSFEGEEGKKTIIRLMDGLRAMGADGLWGGLPIKETRDYLSRQTKRGQISAQNIDLAPSNVLQFVLDDGTALTARPSGTEPKIKFYILARGAKEESKASVHAKITAVANDIGLYVKKNSR